jgi:hypothetical protein
MLRICRACISSMVRASESTRSSARSSDRQEARSTVNTVIEGPALSASDRCDRCGAQAYVRVTMASGFDLLFCSHHSKEHADKLKQVALKIHDESQRIG